MAEPEVVSEPVAALVSCNVAVIVSSPSGSVTTMLSRSTLLVSSVYVLVWFRLALAVGLTFGPWIFPLLRVLAKFKFLRGTAFDPFGYSVERKTERGLIADYEALLDELLAKLNADNHHIAVGLAAIPEKIRGFGFIKLRNLDTAKAEEAALLEQFRSGSAAMLKAAE